MNEKFAFSTSNTTLRRVCSSALLINFSQIDLATYFAQDGRSLNFCLVGLLNEDVGLAVLCKKSYKLWLHRLTASYRVCIFNICIF